MMMVCLVNYNHLNILANVILNPTLQYEAVDLNFEENQASVLGNNVLQAHPLRRRGSKVAGEPRG